MTNNVLNGGLVFTGVLATFALFTPFVNKMLGVVGIRFFWALIAVPFAWLIFFYDETRRFFIRKYPHGWIYRETYY
uniref:Cation_ATPase_C domain-containing protein n=1 Tax=Steinernema glaseri TaxID=37863 RepID=A0A1I7YEG3_9BILA